MRQARMVARVAVWVLLAASVFHFRTFRIEEVKAYLREKGLEVIL